MTTKIEEKFQASFGVPAELPDPVDTGKTSRPADKTQSDEPGPKVSKSKMIADMVHTAYKLSAADLGGKYSEFMKMGGASSATVNAATIGGRGLKEDVEAIFEGEELSEGFRNKATTIFEAAVSAKVVEQIAKLEEEFAEQLEEAIERKATALEEQVKMYMDQLAEEWAEENQLALENGVKASVLESFLGGLKTLFTEHYIEIPDDKVDVVEELAGKVAALTESLNAAKNDLLEQNLELKKATAARIFAESTVGLTESQIDKVRALSESVDFEDEASFRTKIGSLVEGYTNKKPVASAAEQLNEEVLVEDDKSSLKTYSDPLIAAVAKVISSGAAKK